MRRIHRSAFLTLLALVSLLPLRAEAQRARQGMLSLEDARLFYEVVGAGDPIIVVHGGPGLDHSYLQPGLDALGTRHTVVYYDQRGTGRSSAELTPEAINFDAFVDDIDALRQALGYERVSVLGHSFGAMIALRYALRYPDNLRALILMNPTEPGTRFQEQTAERQATRRTEAVAEEMAELRESEAFQARDAATLSRFYRLAFRSVMRNPDQVEQVQLDLSGTTARNGQDVAALLGQSMGAIDWWTELALVQAPTLVLHGRYDAPPIDMARELAEAFPVGSLAVLDTGHFPYVEDRDGLLSAVSGFFAGLRR